MTANHRDSEFLSTLRAGILILSDRGASGERVDRKLDRKGNRVDRRHDRRQGRRGRG